MVIQVRIMQLSAEHSNFEIIIEVVRAKLVEKRWPQNAVEPKANLERESGLFVALRHDSSDSQAFGSRASLVELGYKLRY